MTRTRPHMMYMLPPPSLLERVSGVPGLVSAPCYQQILTPTWRVGAAGARLAPPHTSTKDHFDTTIEIDLS